MGELALPLGCLTAVVWVLLAALVLVRAVGYDAQLPADRTEVASARWRVGVVDTGHHKMLSS